MIRLVNRSHRSGMNFVLLAGETNTTLWSWHWKNLRPVSTNASRRFTARKVRVFVKRHRHYFPFCKYLLSRNKVQSFWYRRLVLIKWMFQVKVSNSGPEAVFLGADDFLPIFVWVLVRTGMVAAEIEAEYMWGLLHPSLLSGEGGYYLTTLSSAVNVLKNFRPVHDSNSVTRLSVSIMTSWKKKKKSAQVFCTDFCVIFSQWCHDPLSEFRSILKVVVPDEMNGSLLTKTLPVRPNMTTRDICKIIALKLRITNPQDYSLFKLVDGEGEQWCWVTHFI